jgi:hypothetical protein
MTGALDTRPGLLAATVGVTVAVFVDLPVAIVVQAVAALLRRNLAAASAGVDQSLVDLSVAIVVHTVADLFFGKLFAETGPEGPVLLAVLQPRVADTLAFRLGRPRVAGLGRPPQAGTLLFVRLSIAVVVDAVVAGFVGVRMYSSVGVIAVLALGAALPVSVAVLVDAAGLAVLGTAVLFLWRLAVACLAGLAIGTVAVSRARDQAGSRDALLTAGTIVGGGTFVAAETQETHLAFRTVVIGIAGGEPRSGVIRAGQ